MNEVSTQTAALVLDSLEQHGLDADAIWRGLPITREHIRQRGARIDWSTWVAMMARIERDSPIPVEDLFAPGAGARTGHAFASIASGLLSVRDLYAFFARWGVRRSFLTARARFEMIDPRHATFVLTLDPNRPGSLPSMRFLVGVLRQMPRLQGSAPATVRMLDGSTAHHAEYSLELPAERPLMSRARRLVRVFAGVTATLDELEAQANEIAAKNIELETQLVETRERGRWLELARVASGIGLWRWDPAVRRVLISETLAVWLGVPGQSEIDTAVWGDLVHPEDRWMISAAMMETIEKRTPFQMEYRVVIPGSNLRWFRVQGRLETDPDGKSYVYGATVDVTDKRMLEERLRLADRMIAAGTLAAGIAHEINNPLTYVIGSLDLIERRLAPLAGARDATESLIAQALDGCERIRAVVADIHTFARHDDNAVVPVDLHGVCTAAIRIVSSDVRQRATVVTELAADTPPVLANDSRLGQVMINLIVNASQAMPANRATDANRIVVRTRRLPNGDAAIDVEDNGTGMPPDVAARVFDPFFTTKPIGIGTGLGLSVCQGIVTALGGRIELDTAIGRGSRFTVTLKGAPDTAAIETAPGRAAGNRVLVIDDEPMIRSVVVRSLVAHGFAVDEADNGRTGLTRALADGPYDTIVCDLVMPDLDGVGLHHELLARSPELAARIVFISGGAITPRAQEFLRQPGIVVVNKPFDLDDLIAAVERAAHGTSTSLPLT